MQDFFQQQYYREKQYVVVSWNPTFFLSKNGVQNDFFPQTKAGCKFGNATRPEVLGIPSKFCGLLT